MATAKLNIPAHSDFASRGELEWMVRNDKPLFGTIGVVIPHGQSTRVVYVEIDEDQLILLAEKALSTARAIREVRAGA